MRVHHLNCATFCPIGGLLVNGEKSPFSRARLVCHCLLCESSDGLILVDTGLGTGDLANPEDTLPGKLWEALNGPQLRIDETAIQQVRALGMNPEDVRHIVLTHLDFDHAGGLQDFPNAQVHVLEREHHAAMRPLSWIERHRYAPHQWGHHPQWVLHEPEGEQWMGFDAVQALDGTEDDVLLVPLPGHTRGHAGVAVRVGEEWLFDCGDAAFHHDELDTLDRSCPFLLEVYQSVFQYDRGLRLDNQERVRELANDPKSKVRVFCSHDPDMLERFLAPVAQTGAYLG